jgi:hypothetical protein
MVIIMSEELDMKARRIVLEFEERIVIFDGEAAKKLWTIIEAAMAKADLDRANYGGLLIAPMPTHIYDARDKADFPK